MMKVGNVMRELDQAVIEKRTYTGDFHCHQHAYGQFLLPLQGSMDIQTRRQQMQLTTDYFLFIPPDM